MSYPEGVFNIEDYQKYLDDYGVVFKLYDAGFEIILCSVPIQSPISLPKLFICPFAYERMSFSVNNTILHILRISYYL